MILNLKYYYLKKIRARKCNIGKINKNSSIFGVNKAEKKMESEVIFQRPLSIERINSNSNFQEHNKTENNFFNRLSSESVVQKSDEDFNNSDDKSNKVESSGSESGEEAKEYEQVLTQLNILDSEIQKLNNNDEKLGRNGGDNATSIKTTSLRGRRSTTNSDNLIKRKRKRTKSKTISPKKSTKSSKRLSKNEIEILEETTQPSII